MRAASRFARFQQFFENEFRTSTRRGPGSRVRHPLLPIVCIYFVLLSIRFFFFSLFRAFVVDFFEAKGGKSEGLFLKTRHPHLDPSLLWRLHLFGHALFQREIKNKKKIRRRNFIFFYRTGRLTTNRLTIALKTQFH